MTSPAHNYFVGRLEELEAKNQRLKATRLATDFPSYLEYDRVNQLVNIV